MNAAAKPLSPPRHTRAARIDAVGVGVGLLAAYNLALGLWMVASPRSFYSALGPFGVRNDHYIRDNATFSLALAAVLVATLRRRGWAAPLLAFSAVQFGLHAANHLNDIDGAHPRWVGALDFGLLAATTLVLALLCRYALADQRKLAERAERRNP